MAPSMALVSLDSPSMAFRSLNRASWPPRHIEECTSPAVLKERHTSLKSSPTSKSTGMSTGLASSGVKVDVAVAATGLKPDHIRITLVPGVLLSTTTGPRASEVVASLLEGDTLFRKDPIPKNASCSYICEGVSGVEHIEDIHWGTLPQFYSVAQLATVVSVGARSWVKKGYQGHLRRGRISPLNGAGLYSSFRIKRIEYFGPEHVRVVLGLDSLLPGISNPQQFFAQAVTKGNPKTPKRPTLVCSYPPNDSRISEGSQSVSTFSSPVTNSYVNKKTLLCVSTTEDNCTARKPHLHPAHTKDPEVARRVLRLWEILS